METNYYSKMLNKSVTLERSEQNALLERYAAIRTKHTREALRIRDKLIVANLRLIPKFLSKGNWRRSPLYDEILQEGVFGLMRALEKFDPERGSAFSTYATWWIRSYTQKYVIEHGRVVRLTSHVCDMQRTAHRLQTNFYAKNGHNMTFDDLFDVMKPRFASKKGLKAALEVDQPALSGDEPRYGPNNDLTLFDMIACTNPTAENNNESRESLVMLSKALHALNAREMLIIGKHFGMFGYEEETLETIGDILKISRERVRQIEAEALVKLGKEFARARAPLDSDPVPIAAKKALERA